MVKYVEDLENTKKVPWILGRWPQTDEELWLFVKAVWGVEIPYRAVCPHHVSPFQAFADAYFARHPVAIWEGSRGFSGKTYTLGLLACTEMLTLRCFVTILGGSAEQSLRVHEAMQNFLDSDVTPAAVKGMVDIMTRYDTRLTNGAKARTLMASQKSVRGPHPQRLRLDEVDEMDWELFKAAQGQPMRSKRLPNVDTQTVASSTHQYCVSGDTMVLTTNGEIKIRSVEPGIEVLTRAGWKKVVRRYDNGIRKVIKLGLSNGRTLICTPDHKILTSIGWLSAGSLAPSSVVTGFASAPVLIVGLNSVGATAVGADNFAGINASRSITSQNIDLLSDRLKVTGADTTSVGTEVIERHTRLGALPQNISGDVGERSFVDSVSSANFPVSVFIGSKLPDPTPSFVPKVKSFNSFQDIIFVNGDLGSTGLALDTEALPVFISIDDLTPTDLTPSVHVTTVSDGGEIQVYDIEVEDQHEFVAEGIMIHNSDGTMTKLKETAKEKGWPQYKWCYKETSDIKHGGWLKPDEVQRKRNEISKEMWKMEYDLLEPSFEGRAIDGAALDRMFDPTLGLYKGVPRQYHEFERPRNDRDYITGVDWAQAQDFTVIWTWDATVLPWKCVAFQRCHREPWPIIIKKASMRLARYGGKLIHDATGIGSVVKDMLELPPGITPRDVKDMWLGGKDRTNMLSEYVAAIEQDSFRCPRIVWAYDEHRFATNDHLYGRLHLPDSICAGALAWHMKKKGLRREHIAAPDISDATKREGGVSPWKLV